MAVKIKLFGQLRQIMGSHELNTDVSDTDALVREINRRFPELEKLNYRIAVDKNIIETNTPIQAGQELALLPPYSGG